MATLFDIANITITKESPRITQVGFGTLLIVGSSAKLPEVDTVGVEFDADLITGNSIVLTVNGVAMSAVEWATSHANTMGLLETALEALDEVNTVTVDGRKLTIVSASDETVVVNSAVVTGGASQATATITREAATRIRYYSDLVSISADFATTDLEYIAAEAAFSQSPQPTRVAIGAKRSGDADWKAALTAITLESDDWYGLAVTTRTQADVEDVAEWIETRIKMSGTTSNNAGILGTGTTDIAAVLNASGYERTHVKYHPDADGSNNDPFPESAWFGKMLPTDPGSATWAYKYLTGVPAVALTTDQETNALAKKCNIYVTIGGVSVTLNGTVASGEWIDTIRGIDWLRLRMAERVFSRLASLPKISYTDSGVAIVEAEIRAQLDDGIAVGFLAADPAYTVTVPKVADVSATEKTARNLPSIAWEATPAGAIQKATIRGIVTF